MEEGLFFWVLLVEKYLRVLTLTIISAGQFLCLEFHMFIHNQEFLKLGGHAKIFLQK